MGFTSKLTEEEEFLKKRYVILRKKKKNLQQLRSKRKQEEAEASETGPSKKKMKKGITRSISESVKQTGPEKNAAVARIRNISSFNAAANTAAAKELIKSGAIKLKVETKTTFKRSLAKKKREETGKKPVFQPFNPGSASSSDQNEDPSPTKTVSDQKNPTSNNSSKTTNNRKEGYNRFSKENRKFDRSAPRKGNTIYIHGYELSASLLEEHFTKFGKIIKVDIEQNSKSGFITFNSFEAADKAIDKMNDAMVAGTRLKVSLARRQRMLESAVSSSVWAPLAVSHSDKGPTNVKEKRALVVYDEDLFSDD